MNVTYLYWVRNHKKYYSATKDNKKLNTWAKTAIYFTKNKTEALQTFREHGTSLSQNSLNICRGNSEHLT